MKGRGIEAFFSEFSDTFLGDCKLRLFLETWTHNDMAKIQLFSIGQCIAFGSKWRQIAAHKTLFPDGTDAVSKLIAIRRNKVMQ